MVNNLTKQTKIITRKNLGFVFFSVGVWALIRFLVVLRNLGQYKNCFEVNIWSKKEHFARHFVVCKFCIITIY